MLDILRSFLDDLFPIDQTVAQLRGVVPEDLIRHYRPTKFVGTITLSDYAHPLIKAAVTANKFHNYPPAATLLATLVDHWLTTIPAAPTLLVPIPLGQRRQKERGFNQVERILTNVKVGDAQVAHLLTRKIETKPQTKLDREQRFRNVQDVFAFNEKVRSKAVARIVIVDDVITTGATLHAAKNTLIPNIPKTCEVITLAIAH